LTDDIIRMRYVEIEGQLRKIIVVVKMRGAAHSPDIREYEITGDGITIGKRLAGYSKLITGIPHHTGFSLGSEISPRRPVQVSDDGANKLHKPDK
jgi:circadian clock protein KaiC